MAITTKNYSVKIELNPRTSKESILFKEIADIVKRNEKDFPDKVKLQATIEAEIQAAIEKHNLEAGAKFHQPDRKPTRKFHMGHGSSHIWISVLQAPQSESKSPALAEVMNDRAISITFQNIY